MTESISAFTFRIGLQSKGIGRGAGVLACLGGQERLPHHSSKERLLLSNPHPHSASSCKARMLACSDSAPFRCSEFS